MRIEKSNSHSNYVYSFIYLFVCLLGTLIKINGVISIIPACYTPLGMDDRTISDAQIKASSRFSDQFRPEFGRLNNVPGTWCARTTDKNQWLQV